MKKQILTVLTVLFVFVSPALAESPDEVYSFA
jgi:hypothetical protein